MSKKYILLLLMMILAMLTLSYSGLLFLLVLIISLFLMVIYREHLKEQNKLKEDLESLSTSIESSLNGQSDSQLYIEDTLVSKIAHQNSKLIKRLDFYHAKEKDDRMRLEQLIGDISHQLKTPFANVKMYQELLITCDEKDKDKLAEALIKQTHKMEWLIESLMLLSKIESGCLNLNPSENDLNQTILEAINMVHHKAVKKDIMIVYKPSQRMINHDQKWTSEAIFNVLDNAVKYSQAKTKISISITTSDMFESIEIDDQGMGIKEEELNLIFQRFYKGQASKTYEGVGIGLYLAQEIMMKQGGYIYCKSCQKGSRFTLNFKNH
ncbi:HAMP domain-containing sensor histidine kinase [Acidaminobacter sp. JC074]|uniref:sensor histidine kinase n=1 Tax=Acidaminobacter sp. JC074 TaxID=2530199 RepID=UPI001F105134|nr:HAMP domain-containing sensor histidine kinase [Acidaminobacter sp. JC074]